MSVDFQEDLVAVLSQIRDELKRIGDAMDFMLDDCKGGSLTKIADSIHDSHDAIRDGRGT